MIIDRIKWHLACRLVLARLSRSPSMYDFGAAAARDCDKPRRGVQVRRGSEARYIVGNIPTPCASVSILSRDSEPRRGFLPRRGSKPTLGLQARMSACRLNGNRIKKVASLVGAFRSDEALKPVRHLPTSLALKSSIISRGENGEPRQRPGRCDGALSQRWA